MKQIFTSLLFCIFLFASCQNAFPAGQLIEPKHSSLSLKEEIPQDFIPVTYTVASIGDSLTQGFGDSTNSGGYLPHLKEHLEEKKGISEATMFNYGIGGNRTPQILERVQTKEVKEAIKKADTIIITTGGNDIMKVVRENFFQLDLKQFDRELLNFETTLDSLIHSIREENQQALICLIGLYNPFYTYFPHIKEMDLVLSNWNEVSETVITSYENTLFVKIDDIFKESDENLLYTDFFHPNDRGYERIAERVFEVLEGDI